MKYVSVTLLACLGLALGAMLAYYCIQHYIDAHYVDKTYGYDDNNAPLILDRYTCGWLEWTSPSPCDGELQ